jgi:nucleoside-diphosphate-sugar epimerase
VWRTLTSRPILVTGAEGYLGSEIRRCCTEHGISCRILKIPPQDDKIKAMLPEDAVVIHCAAKVPHSQEEADNYTQEMQNDSVRLVAQLIAAKPAFVVFPSTLETEGLYAAGKRRAEAMFKMTSVPSIVLRFPGMFGPPRRGGLVYNVAREALQWEEDTISNHVWFHPIPPTWTCIHIHTAAMRCLAVAAVQRPATEPLDCRDQLIDDFLDFVRAG